MCSSDLIVNAAIAKVVGRALPAAVLERAWGTLTFTLDPLAATLRRSAEDAVAVGLLREVTLDGIYDLTLLNTMLARAGRPRVPA